MCLCPGTYQGEESFLNSMVIHEAAFGPLEEIIEKHSPQYARPYAHWGVSVVSREEWMLILDNWEEERVRLQNGGGLPTASRLVAYNRLVSGTTGSEPNLPENTRRLMVLIEELSEWLRKTLQTYDQVCILGI